MRGRKSPQQDVMVLKPQTSTLLHSLCNMAGLHILQEDFVSVTRFIQDDINVHAMHP